MAPGPASLKTALSTLKPCYYVIQQNPPCQRPFACCVAPPRTPILQLSYPSRSHSGENLTTSTSACCSMQSVREVLTLQYPCCHQKLPLCRKGSSMVARGGLAAVLTRVREKAKRSKNLVSTVPAKVVPHTWPKYPVSAQITSC